MLSCVGTTTGTNTTGFGEHATVLEYRQVCRLHDVLSHDISIAGRGSAPVLETNLQRLVKTVREKLINSGIVVKDIRLNGGAAAYVINSDNNQMFNDFDLIFLVELSSNTELDKIRSATLSSLLDFLRDGSELSNTLTPAMLEDIYAYKMVKVFNDTDRWSLISLSNCNGPNIELKFVDSMRRQYEFSVDSFQIVIDSLLTFSEISEFHMREDVYPTIVVESVYGDVGLAIKHLNNKLIATKSPEQIRGGGLLKYCHLIVREFKMAPDVDARILERYMCSRFFIDFPSIEQQRAKLLNYLANHFAGDQYQTKYHFLITLCTVVNDSTICLMGLERKLTLCLIQQMANHMSMEHERHSMSRQISPRKFHTPQQWCARQYYCYGPVMAEHKPPYYLLHSYQHADALNHHRYCPHCPPDVCFS